MEESGTMESSQGVLAAEPGTMESVEEPVKDDADDFGDFDGFTAAPALASASGPDPVSPPVLAAEPGTMESVRSLWRSLCTMESVEEPVKEDADDFGDFDGFTAAPALASASGPDPVSPPVLAAEPGTMESVKEPGRSLWRSLWRSL